MANLLAMGPLLLKSGTYSDFTIVCENEEFQVHKAIVCSQSPVLAAAVRNGFKEAETNRFHVVDFDITTVKSMIRYMYTGKYEDVPGGGADDAAKDQTGGSADDVAQDQTGGNEELRRDKSMSDTWVYHGLVYCIADFFCLPGLAQMATAKLDNLIERDWSTDAFCSVFEATYERTAGTELRLMLQTRAVDHIGELVEWRFFNGTDMSEDMMFALLRRCFERMTVEASRVKEYKELLENIGDTTAIAYSYAYCRGCEKDFPSGRPSEWEDDFMVVCKKCHKERIDASGIGATDTKKTS
ncbi:hypothetical protein F4802DRAFT_613944 [Xylaria palmicola]|nr:hypothetical protein F4802DRAFT_613944 [Xylaria palmicola]